jgi:hypothetical protein
MLDVEFGSYRDMGIRLYRLTLNLTNLIKRDIPLNHNLLILCWVRIEFAYYVKIYQLHKKVPNPDVSSCVLPQGF